MYHMRKGYGSAWFVFCQANEFPATPSQIVVNKTLKDRCVWGGVTKEEKINEFWCNGYEFRTLTEATEAIKAAESAEGTQNIKDFFGI